MESKPARIAQSTGPPAPTIPYIDYALEGWRSKPQKTALISVPEEKSLTFEQLECEVLGLAGFLQDNGVKSQSHVQFFCQNSLKSLVAQQALLFSSCRVFNFKVNETVRFTEYKFQTDDAKIEFVITDAENYDLVAFNLLTDPGTTVKRIFIVDRMPDRRIDSSRVTVIDSDLLPDANHFAKPKNVDVKSDILIVSYTSGSTGMPKGVMHSHSSVVAALHNCRHEGLISPDDRFLLMSTLTYVSGIMVSCQTLSDTTTLILAHHGYDEVFPELIEKYSATSFILLECPLRKVLENYGRFPRFREMVKSIKTVLLGGTVFPEKLREKCYEIFKGVNFRNCYGQTEAMGIITQTANSPRPLNQVGSATVNMEVRVLRTDRTPVSVGEIGEIEWRSPQKFLGYWNRPCDDFTDDGFVKSGDLGFIDENGCLTIACRSKHFMICLDERISPTEIENVLFDHPAIAEVVVVPTPHEIVQDAPTAMVVLKKSFKPNATEEREALQKDIKDFVASRLTDIKHLHGGVHFVDSLPQTESGKYARHLVEKMALQLSNCS